MSYFFLATSDGGTGDGAEYAVSREFAFAWGIYEGVSQEFTFINDIYGAVQAAFTFKWNILGYISKQFTFKWNIGEYIAREFTFAWNVYAAAADIGRKAKYTFKAAPVVNRFYRKYRNG